jgi:hypothetical protein
MARRRSRAVLTTTFCRAGAGIDHVVFTAHYGSERIADFRDGADRIDLGRFGCLGADAAKVFAVQVGSVVVVTFASGAVLNLHNIDLLTLSDSDFAPS